MAVNPISIDTENRIVHTEHDGHEGEISLDDVTFPMIGDVENLYSMYVPCSVCGITSTHPVSGGSAPTLVQQVFINKLRERHTGRTFNQAKVLTREMIRSQEGIWRWYNDELTEE